MNIFSLIYLFSFVPIGLFALIFWLDINGKKQFGNRPFQFLLSIAFFLLTGLFLLIFSLLPAKEIPASTSSQLMLSNLIYLASFFFLEYSIHSQRLKRSFFIDKFLARLKTYFSFLIALALLTLTSLIIFILHDFLNGSLVKALNLLPALKLMELEQAGLLGEEDFYFLQRILLIIYSIGFYIFIFALDRNLFLFETEVIRRNLMLNMTVIFSYTLLIIIVIFRGINKDYPNWIFILNNLGYFVRFSGEYFFQRTKNLDSLIRKQETALQNKNELITNIINSPLEEDFSFIRKTVLNEMERAKSFLALPEHSLTGVIVYMRDGDLLKVNSSEQIIGPCIPIMRLDTLKLCKNIDQLNGVILRTPFDLQKINCTSRDQLTSWGEQILKDVIQTQKEQIIENPPAETKGHLAFIALYPVYEKENLMGLLVCFKNSFNKLFPEEENALNNLVENLKVIFAIIRGKHIQQERNRLQGELDIAKRIQTSILPSEISCNGYECAANMVTATEVGGDAYDYCPSPFGTYLGIGDASGHGLPAGITALIQLTAFQSIVRTAGSFEKQISPAEVYDLVNKVLCEINRKRIGSDKFMTQNYFLIQDKVFKFAGAHLIALKYEKNKNSIVLLPELANRTAFLGISEYISSSSSTGEFSLEAGDLLLLYTDGIIESKNNAAEQFGIERLKEIMLENINEPCSKIITAIMEAVKEHARLGDLKKYKGNLADDASLLVIRKL